MLLLWRKLVKSSRRKKKWRKVSILQHFILHALVSAWTPSSLTVGLLQELLFQRVCLLTTACATSPPWRATLMWFWRRGILSKCKLKKIGVGTLCLVFRAAVPAWRFYFCDPSNSDLGVHVDGFISNVAHSLIVGVTKVWLRSPVHFPALFHSFLKQSMFYGIFNK